MTCGTLAWTSANRVTARPATIAISTAAALEAALDAAIAGQEFVLAPGEYPVSRLYNITIVLKGHYTMTVRPDSKVYVNSSGNPGMATPGSGDVLTGVIASLIAQNYPADWSVVLGVYLHGLAGDLAAQEHGTYGMIASDIVENLGKAIIEVMK